MYCIGALACLILTTVLSEVQVISSQLSPKSCDACVKVVSGLEILLKKDVAQVELKSFLQEMCGTLPDDQQQKCEDVLEYYPLVDQILLHNVENSQVCQILGFCPTSDLVATEETDPPSTEDIQCDMCKIAIDKVKSMISDHATEKDVKDAMSKVCNVIPRLYRSKCKKFIGKYSQQIVKYLLALWPTKKICSAIGLCTADIEAPIDEITPLVNDNVECELCNIALDKVKSMIGENATENKIKDVLDEVCSKLPDMYRPKCEILVAKYSQQIINSLLSSWSTEQICSILRLCTVEIAGSVSQTEPPNTNDIGCSLCKLVINELKSMLSDKATKEEVEQALEQVCQQLPDFFQGPCKLFIDRFTSQIVDMLISGLSADQICGSLGLCSAVIEDKSGSLMFVAEKNDPELLTEEKGACAACQLLVANLNRFIQKTSSVAEIENVLLKVCPILPSEDRPQCMVLVKQYVPVLIELLSTLLDPTAVCEAVKLCDKPSENILFTLLRPSQQLNNKSFD